MARRWACSTRFISEYLEDSSERPHQLSIVVVIATFVDILNNASRAALVNILAALTMLYHPYTGFEFPDYTSWAARIVFVFC